MTPVERLEDLIERLCKLKEETSDRHYSTWDILKELAHFMQFGLDELIGDLEEVRDVLIEDEEEQK